MLVLNVGSFFFPQKCRSAAFYFIKKEDMLLSSGWSTGGIYVNYRTMQ